MLLRSQSSIFLKQRRRRFCLFLLSRRATALHHEARPTSFSYAAHANTSTGDEQPTVAVRYKAACAQGLRSADHGSTSSRPRSMKDVATTSMGEGVLRSVILRYLRRRSTPTGPSRMAPERQAACGMAWIWRIGVAGSAPRLQGREITRRDDGVHFLGTLDEVLFGRRKRLDAQSGMADVSLAAMTGVTAADHERISKFCTP